MYRKITLETLESLCLSTLANLLELDDEDHDNSYNVIIGLPEIFARGIFNKMHKFNRSTLRHFSTGQFLHCLDISNSRITNEVCSHASQANITDVCIVVETRWRNHNSTEIGYDKVLSCKRRRH